MSMLPLFDSGWKSSASRKLQFKTLANMSPIVLVKGTKSVEEHEQDLSVTIGIYEI